MNDATNPNAELMFGILSIYTAAAAYVIMNYAKNEIYAFPLFYNYQYVWYNAADY